MLKRLHNVSIRTKIVGGSALTLTLISVFIFAYYPAKQKQNALKQLISKSEAVADRVALSVGIGLESRNLNVVSNVLNWAQRDTNLVYIILINSDGSQFARYDPHNVFTDHDSGMCETGTVEFDNRQIHNTYASIEYNGKNYGALAYGISLAELNAAATEDKVNTLYTSAALLLFGCLSAYVFSRRITTPILKLRDAALRFAEKDYDVRLGSFPNDEIGDLSKSFTLMAENIRNAVKEVETLNRDITLVLESAGQGILGLDRYANATFVNEIAARQLGSCPDKLVGQNLMTLLQSDRSVDLCESESELTLQQLLAGQADKIPAGPRFRKWSGGDFPVDGVITSIKENGKTYGAVVCFTDATERIREEESKSLLITAVEQVAEAIMVTDQRAVIKYVNPSFERVTGYRRGEACGQNPRILKSGRQDEEFYAKLWAELEEGRVWNGRVTNARKDGSHYTADVTISPVRDKEGRVTHFVAIQRDVTRMLDLEMQLQQAQKLEAVGSLAAGIAHEINTPIQFVGDNTQFFSDAFDTLLKLTNDYHNIIGKTLDGDLVNHLGSELSKADKTADLDYLRTEIPEAIEQTLQGIQRVTAIVRAMKDFSHSDSGEMTLTNINDVIRTTLTVARNEYKYVAEIELNLGADLPETFCYRNELNQVFLNLIVNAAHAIADVVKDNEDEKGVIRVSTERQNGFVVVSVKDSGTGIKEKHRNRIFEQFYTTKQVGKGTGQGLAIAHSVVAEKHGGQLTFDTKLGEGTTFYVKLPLRTEA